MTGFEPRTSGIGSDRSTNWATTTARLLPPLCHDYSSNRRLNKVYLAVILLTFLKFQASDNFSSMLVPFKQFFHDKTVYTLLGPKSFGDPNKSD